MNQFIKKLITNRYLPRWVVFAFDIFAVTASFLLAYSLRYNFAGSSIDTTSQSIHLLLALLAYVTGFLIFRPFAGIIRHTTWHDLTKILLAVLTGGVIMAVFSAVARSIG